MMTGDDFKIAMAALNLDGPKAISEVFKVARWTAWRWTKEGPPPHIELAVDEMLAGYVSRKGLWRFLRRMNKAYYAENARFRFSKSSPSSTADSMSE